MTDSDNTEPTRVVVIDDHPTVREATAAYLAQNKRSCVRHDVAPLE